MARSAPLWQVGLGMRAELLLPVVGRQAAVCCSGVQCCTPAGGNSERPALPPTKRSVFHILPPPLLPSPLSRLLPLPIPPLLAGFVSEMDGELSVEPGERVKVHSEVEGWARVIRLSDNRSGLVPSWAVATD